MVCMKSCIIASMFIVAMIFTMYKSDSISSVQQFTQILSIKQKAIYKKITDERPTETPPPALIYVFFHPPGLPPP